MADRVLMKGNEAMAEAAIRAGCRHFFGYPITPQTELSAYMAKQMPKVGGTFLQAESEIAAINMVMGAAAAGVRAMTSSSSPGISLKSEGISYLAAADLPCLIVNVQRGSPGLGGIQPSQADYSQATKAPGHGDFHLLVYAPATVQEMVDLVYRAFENGEYYRMPAMILADGMLGQMMEPVTFSRQPAAPLLKPWAIGGVRGGRPRNVVNTLHLKPETLESLVQKRYQRYEQAQKEIAEAELVLQGDEDILLVAYGASARIARSALDSARERGIRVGMVRPITLWPFPARAIAHAAHNCKVILAVEMSMGQIVPDIELAVRCKVPVEFLGHTGGVVPTPDEVLQRIIRLMGGA